MGEHALTYKPYQKWCLRKANVKRNRLLNSYEPNESILDIGSGNCAFNLQLTQAGLNVTGVDIASKSAFKEVTPIIYDGITLPFEDNSFDVVQMITVLHHIQDPEQTLKEAIRVGKRVIVMEDIYTNGFQKQLTFFVDSLNNWEFRGHPHTNKTDKEWRDLFRTHGLSIKNWKSYRFLMFFKQVTYWLEK